ncbi:choice-of-anchor L domain-containing protein [Psychroserpens mesophilus]|uniref:choice-of-anchor L domain-containing protein n=1 Tax=Psychroserpens mesophilus TaxID=325473 RepID=UPI003F49373E
MKIIKCLCFGLFLCSIFTLSAQQITTENSGTLEALIQANLGQGCVDISNVSSSVNGQFDGLDSYGYFEKGDSNFPFQNGVVLSTGSIHSGGNNVNTANLNEGSTNWPSDSDLETVLGISGTLNATSIEFDFLSTTNFISFDYILASEEYNTNFPCQYSDGFAFLIKRVGSTDPFVNIALIPGTNIPVNTNTIHDEIVGFCPAENEIYFEGYNIGDTNYNGRTTVLTASADILPNELYRIKLIIADQTDQNYDSAVFIQSTSTLSSVDLGPDINTCSQSVVLNGDVSNNIALYQWFKDGLAIPGATSPIYTVNESGTYSLLVDIPINNTSCIIEDEIIINLGSEQDVAPITDFVVCDDASNDGVEIFDLTTKDDEILAAIPSGTYDISYHLTSVGAINDTSTIVSLWPNTSNPQTIYVRTEETNTGCLGFTSFDLIVNNSPVYNQPSDLNICDDTVQDGITSIDLEAMITQITSDNPNLLVSYYTSFIDAELGLTPIELPYVNTNPSETLFIRIEDTFTGCYDITSFVINVLENPVINEEIQWIDACESDDDGFEIFDLTSVVDDILQGLGGVSVTFYETQTDAEEDINEILDPTAYQNTNPYFQLVYIKVTNDATGCISIMPIELHTNIVETGFDKSDFGVCDDETNDGIADFDLNDVETALINYYLGYDISFYETVNDQLNNNNALNKAIPFTATSIITTIYIAVTLDSCVQYTSMELVIHPAIEIQPLATVDYCDDDFDGFTPIVLSSFNSYVSTGIDSPSVKYYLTEQDAIDDQNALPQSYTNIVNPITVFIRVTNTETDCYDISPFEILVIDPPVVMQPVDIIICDDDQDGFSIVDLESKISEIVPDITDLTISFHLDFSDADNGTNAIPIPNNFNTQTQTIYVRVESDITTCHSIVDFETIINTLPEFIPISTFVACEDDGDEMSDFLFFQKDEEILNGQTGKEVLYFETAQDAMNRTNSIDKNTAYQNLSNPQTIFTRVENITDINCFGTSSFQITVTQLPTFNIPTEISVCDDVSNDGIVTSDLNLKIQEITNGITENLDITFHESFNDADLGVNDLPLNYTNTINPQHIFVRVDNGTVCYSITDFMINVVQVPEINDAPDVIVCDSNYDGLTQMDITIIETSVLDVRADDIVLTYHETIDGAETNSETISDPTNYSNLANPQIVYLKVNNTISNCYSLVPVNLIVDLPPPINDFQTYDTCMNASNSFDLNEINDVLVDDDTNVQIDYYISFADAQTSSNTLNTNYTYVTFSDTIFARIENSETGCFYVYPFQLIVNELPVANQPPDLQICDDESNDNAGEFNLFLVNNAVLGAQSANDFTVTYYGVEAEADLGNSPLPYNYSGQGGETIYARIENNSTGCYSVTQFDLIVNEYPNVPSLLVTCDTDYDAVTSFDLTQAESELFNTVNPDHIISYFESLEDLQNGVNAIADPTNYINLISPQTVYIKVFNTIADCYMYVPLELEVNLPPAINALNSFELCETDTGIVTLSDLNSPLLMQTANVVVEYYASEANALNQTNPLDDNYEYQSTSDVIFARVEFSTTHCYHIHAFDLIINPLPIANIPDDLAACDDDNDGLFSFELTSQNATILNGQNPDEFTVSYHSDLISAEDNINALDNSYVSANGETIYVRLENNTTGCYDITSFNIIIHPKPIVNIDSQVICLDNLPLIVSANTNQIGDSYVWSTNETTPDIEITEVGTYSVTVTSPSGCETTEFFTVTESQAATMVITESINFSDPNNIIVTVNGIGNYLYQLDDNDPQISNVFENVSLGYHTITVVDLNGCDTITKNIIVVDVPKFMTPNDDGKFDTWHITGVETLPGTIIYIFDRYGKLLKTLTSNSPGWNGYYNGKLMPNSDYWFLAKVKDGNNTFEVKGHFALRY